MAGGLFDDLVPGDTPAGGLFDDLVTARMGELPEGVKPSTAGAGRGGQGGPTAEELEAYRQSKQPKGRGFSPYKAPQVTPAAPAPAPGSSILDRPAQGYVDNDERSPAKREADQRQAIDDARRARLYGTSSMAPSGRGVLSSMLDTTVRKPLDNSLAGLGLEALGDAARGVARGSANVAGSVFSAGQAVAETLGGDGGASQALGEMGRAARAGSDALANPLDRNSLTQQVFESTFTNAAIMGTLGFGNAALAAMGAQAAANDYGESRDRGLSNAQALERAPYMGAAEMIGERFGLPQLGTLFAKAAAKVSTKEMGHVLANLLVKEQIGEQVTTAMQDAYEKMGVRGRKPDMTLADYLDDVANTAKVTLGQSLLMGGAAAGVRALPRSAERQVADAIQQGVDSTYFTQAGINDFALQAQSPNSPIFDPAAVLPRDTRKTGLLAQMSGAGSDVSQPGPDIVPTPVAVPRAEDMPTTPLTPEQTAVMAASHQATQAAQKSAEKVTTDQAGSPPAAGGIGTLGVRQGTLAVQAEQLLRENAQGAANATGQTAQAQPTAAPVPERGVGRAGGDGQRAAAAATGPADAFDQHQQRYQGRIAELQGIVDRLNGSVAQARATGTKDGQTLASRYEHHLKHAQLELDAMPHMERPEEGPELQSFNRLADAFESAFGYRPVAYVDRRDTHAADGFADRETGQVFVNLANPERSVAFTVFHEHQHSVRIAASRGDRQAQLATQMLDQVWGMIPTEAKQQYAQRYLFRHAIAAGAMTPEQALAHKDLRDEMLSDFMGKRATDTGFWLELAQKKPDGFGAFVKSWLGSLARLLKALRGLGGDGHLKDVDRAIGRHLERAKMVAERVVQEWARMNPKLASEQGIEVAADEEQAQAEPASSRTPKRSERMAGGVRAELDSPIIQTDTAALQSEQSLRASSERGESGQERDSQNAPEGQSGQAVDRAAIGNARAEGGRAVTEPGDRRSGGPDAPGGQRRGDLAGQPVPEGQQQGVTPRYGTPREGASSVLGYHYSREDRSTLAAVMHGSGLAGAESERLADAPRELRQRIYFYIDRGTGISPEAGVGGRAHRVELTNLYDADEDALRLVRDARGPNGFELAVVKAGFDGYFTRDAGPSGNAVLLGQHAVPVQQLGPATKLKADKVVPPAKPRVLTAPERIAANTSLPAGSLAGTRWAQMVRAMMPAEWTELQDNQVWQSDERMYRDELARKLKGGAPMLSRRMSELGAFNLDHIDDTLDYKEGGELTEEDMAAISSELDAELSFTPPPVQEYDAPSDASLKSVGILAEDAYKPLQFAEDIPGQQDAAVIRFRGDSYRRQYVFTMEQREEGGSNLEPPILPEAGSALSYRNVSERFAKAMARRVAASIDLMGRKFDLFTAVPAAARTRVADAWRAIAQLPGAAEFRRPEFDKTAPSVDKLQQIADTMLKGTRWSMSVSADGKYFELSIKDAKAPPATEQQAQIEFVGGADKRLVVHAIDLAKGTGAGKVLYQVAFAFGHATGVPVAADPQGLTGVNTYRRTEQMMSSAARFGEAGGMKPGVGQRVYGWNDRANTPDQRVRNLTRLALAAARNAMELAPQARDLTYDLASDTFGWRAKTKHDQSAEEYVRDALRSKDARSVSLSRSTLARAAVTFQAIDGTLKLDGIERAASPVLYSARGDYAERDSRAIQDDKAGGKFIHRGHDGSQVESTSRADALSDIERREQAVLEMLDCLRR